MKYFETIVDNKPIKILQKSNKQKKKQKLNWII